MSSSLPSLFKPKPEPRYVKYVKYGVLILVVAVVLSAVLWFVFRFHSEESTVATFMSDVVAGQYQQAYGMWSKTSSTYKYEDFLQDWGPKGYYGPVRSFKIAGAHELKGASGVIVVVDVSPFKPFPTDTEFEKANKTKEVRLWVQFSDQTISYAP
jgi:hypothetical protein